VNNFQKVLDSEYPVEYYTLIETTKENTMTFLSIKLYLYEAILYMNPNDLFLNLMVA
jgi:hypothetical protein